MTNVKMREAVQMVIRKSRKLDNDSSPL